LVKKTKRADNIMMKQKLCAASATRGKIILLMTLVLIGAAELFAAPLDGNYAMAPAASAPVEVKAAASREARLKVLKAAEKYEHTPYRSGGMDRTGLECSGLIYVSFHDALGVSLPRSTSGLYAWVEKISNEQLQPGDILFFKTNNTGTISHAALYTGNGRFIHAASEGAVTGVIYSGIGEGNWASRYAGAGRALPEASINETWNPDTAAATAVAPAPAEASTGGGKANVANPAAAAATANPAAVSAVNTANSGNSAATPAAAPGDSGTVRPGRAAPGWVSPPPSATHEDSFVLGFALAPSWNGLYMDGGVLRGFATQFRVGYATRLFNKPMLFGAEFRPEWDEGLGVLRIPLTVSWGFDDRFRVFLGPALSIGDATLGSRRYGGGTSLIGAIGITAAPFIFKVAGGELAPYAELAWQSYISENPGINMSTDLAAALRFSTGIRYTWKFR
jgi:probable lipoprotein NlpC